jgi:glycosyltransferase involved in cell wall biosynthesis
MAALVREVSAGEGVPLPFLNGFCLLISRAMLQDVGIFDEETFGAGYGEENDLCIRARKRGWGLAVAEDAYVFHAQSRSYSADRRKQLAARADVALAEKHDPAEHILPQVGASMENLALLGVRARITAGVERKRLVREARPRWEGRRLLFILPSGGEGGGAKVVLNEASALQKLGVDAWILNFEPFRADFEANNPGSDVPALYLNDPTQVTAFLRDRRWRFDAVVATLYSSIYWIPTKGNFDRVGYYIQDYEPLFFPEGIERQAAFRSYTARPDARLFAKTAWTADQVAKATGRCPAVVGPSVDLHAFRPPVEGRAGPIQIAAMVRPSTPRRAPERTIAVLAALQRRFRGAIRVVTFGADRTELAKAGLRLHDAVSYGTLSAAQVSTVLAQSDIFLDLSHFQAMGLTTLEAMASACAVVAPQEGGVSEYARHEGNALLVDTRSLDACEAAAARLIEDHGLRRRLQKQAASSVCAYYPEAAAVRILEVLLGEPAT